MKWSKKQQAEWDRKNRVKHEGHAANNLEFDYIEQGKKLAAATRKIQKAFDRRIKQKGYNR